MGKHHATSTAGPGPLMRGVNHIAFGLAATRAHLDDALEAVNSFRRGRGGPRQVDEALCEAIASLDEVWAQWSELLEKQHPGAARVPPLPRSPCEPFPGPSAVPAPRSSSRHRLARLWRR